MIRKIAHVHILILLKIHGNVNNESTKRDIPKCMFEIKCKLVEKVNTPDQQYRKSVSVCFHVFLLRRRSNVFAVDILSAFVKLCVHKSAFAPNLAR